MDRGIRKIFTKIEILLIRFKCFYLKLNYYILFKINFIIELFLQLIILFFSVFHNNFEKSVICYF